MGEYEPITKELRDYASVAWEPWAAARERLLQMCDNIDAVHRSLEQENERLRDASERGDDWIRLPVDADGESIHIGDVMGGTCPSGKHVNGPVKAIGDGVFWLSNVSFKLSPEYMHHFKPDTWESIISDAMRAGRADVAVDVMPLIKRCKALCERTREGEE